jgi:hypothetical protein
MIKMIQSSEILPQMNKFMFSCENMAKGYKYQAPRQKEAVPQQKEAVPRQKEAVPQQKEAVPPQKEAVPPQKETAHHNKPFTPFQKDKLFWCFYIILNGYDEYQLNNSTSFTIEKQLKIETVEKLKTVKEKLKELKLKRTELEDELVNKPMITLKGLYALCLVHNVSITYIYGRKYCELLVETADKKGIIMQNAKKEDSIKWIMSENAAAADAGEDFLTQIRKEYWLIENIQKPLNAPSAYALQELSDICDRLQIETHAKTGAGDKTKAKTKKQLYEEILSQL